MGGVLFAMTKAEKELEKIKNNPKNVSKERLQNLLKRYDCMIKEGGRGSHFAVTHELVDYTLTIPSNKPIKTPYVKDCLKLIEEIIELTKEME